MAQAVGRVVAEVLVECLTGVIGLGAYVVFEVGQVDVTQLFDRQCFPAPDRYWDRGGWPRIVTPPGRHVAGLPDGHRFIVGLSVIWTIALDQEAGRLTTHRD